MANLSAALNSLASTTLVDFLHARSKDVSEEQSLRRARIWTIVWGAVLLAIAIAARHSESVLVAGLTIGSIPMGALLGVFLLGVLTDRPREIAAVAGVIAGLAAVLYVHFGIPQVAWTWYVLIGTTVTFGVGWLASLFQPTEPRP
jgi:Na+/proline symporter